MSQPPEDKKPDFSSLPRGAIGIKGLPVSRNTRLPSIRSPRDLTLGALPKKTYMPNIPVRREKKPPVSENALSSNQETSAKLDKQRNSLQAADRGRGRGRRQKQIIQTQGSIFGEGIAQDPLTRKEKIREAYQRSDFSRGVSVKKEKNDDIVGVSKRMDNLLRDDFIDDGDDDDDVVLLKPTIFPGTADVKKETKSEAPEPPANFNPDIAKEMGFDVNQVAKFIKKEKDAEVAETPNSTSKEVPSSSKSGSVRKTENNIKSLLTQDSNSPKLVLLQFPQFTVPNPKTDDSEPSHKQPVDSKVPNNQTSGRSALLLGNPLPGAALQVNYGSMEAMELGVIASQLNYFRTSRKTRNPPCASIKSLPEGYIGKLKIMKSGKAKLVIGAVELCLDNIDSFHSQHEVVSIRTDCNSGDLSVLGCLEQKVKFVPDEDILLA